MFDLSVPEATLFVLVAAVHLAAGVLAIVQVLRRRGRHTSLLAPLISVGVALEAILLGLRGVAIRAVPLTGLFESLIVLALVFGVLCLLLHLAVGQVWLGSVMVWVTLGMVLMAGFVADPASRPQAVAATPWAIAHATAMILAAASVMFAAVSSILYLLGSRQLKRKKITHVLGRIPNMEVLGHMNRVGLGVGFALLTVGFVSGLGLVSLLGTSVVAWLTDGKVICIMAVWILLGVVLVLDRLSLLREKARAYVTIAAFALVLLAIMGVTVAGVTRHEFSLYSFPAAPVLTA